MSCLNFFKDGLLQIKACATGCYMASTSLVLSGKLILDLRKLSLWKLSSKCFQEIIFCFSISFIFAPKCFGDLVKSFFLYVYHQIFMFSVLVSVEGGGEKISVVGRSG